MKLNRIIIIFVLLFFINSCADYSNTKKNELSNKIFYTSKGFALIYEENLHKQKIINKKIDNDGIVILHSFLKRNTPIKIINQTNSKSVKTKVHKNAKYPKIFNVVISRKIANILELDENNPYVEIIEFKKNKTFIAGEVEIFDEEKKVATKVLINEIKMDDLSVITNEETKENFEEVNFILVISDFYYIKSAENLKKNLITKLNNNDLNIKKITNNQYRLFAGPFKNFNSLKSTYISLNNLGFDELNILREIKQ